MKKLSIIAVLMLLVSIQAGAETYSWVDENGTWNFTEDLSRVPKKYRGTITTRDGIEGSAASQSAPAAAVSVKPAAAPKAEAAGSSQAQSQQSDGLYGGKKPESWQAEMGPLYAEVKRLEQELEQFEKRIKSPRGVSREEMAQLSPRFKETQMRYREVLKSYNDLNDAANKVGLPAEFRK